MGVRRSRIVFVTAALSAADAFHVALDAKSIQGLRGQFAVLELPTERCRGKDAEDQRWHPHCAHGLTRYIECMYNGFQYSMEWYFIQMLRDNHQFLADDPSSASFVYFPQCVSQVYFALRGEYGLTHWAAIAAAETEYMIPLLRWAHGTPEHRRHGGHNFWTVFSMDLGRQDFPRSAAWLESWSVGSLTGSQWWLWEGTRFLGRQRQLQAMEQEKDVLTAHMDRPTSPSSASEDCGCWWEDTAPVTVASEMFPARNFRTYDTVISIPSRFAPFEARTRRFSPRPILVFFHGSPNSCARRQILDRYSHVPDFDVSTSILNDTQYRERLWSSRYCLVLRGSSHTNNVRLYDVIAHGCVPVVVSDDFQPPLDEWLPWNDIAIFLPTSSIPRLEQILREEISEEQRQRYFDNVAVGSSPLDDERADALIASSGNVLDLATLWSGLSAARVFNWDGSDFWLLFFADIAVKLSARVRGDKPQYHDSVQVGLPCMRHDVSSKTERYSWKRKHIASDGTESNDWKSDNGVGDGTADSKTRFNERKDALLLVTLQFVYDMLRKRERGTIPGVIVDCGLNSVSRTTNWFHAFADVIGEDAEEMHECSDHEPRVGPRVAYVSLEASGSALDALQSFARTHGWEGLGWTGELLQGDVAEAFTGVGKLDASSGSQPLYAALQLAAQVLTQGNVLPAAFLLRVTRKSGGVRVLRALSSRSAIAVPVKFLLLDTGVSHVFRWTSHSFVVRTSLRVHMWASARWRRRRQRTLQARRASLRASGESVSGDAATRDMIMEAATAGWLCFCVLLDGRLRPAFAPFVDGSTSARCTSWLFCGREDDPELDTVVRLIEGGAVVAGPAPTRWGAAPLSLVLHVESRDN
eukprot:TRINITY_DN13251_c3_g1_i1.p1 TRINITY_DN13251_c3_g1~~TRINITY_DN13251_c3_g1_i1.p1  ORF type:complete len:895 (+),score=87.86 TRINITY_DN13251_c3_g1_i1:90-2687(+)